MTEGDDDDSPIDFYLEPGEEVDAPPKKRRSRGIPARTPRSGVPGEDAERGRFEAQYRRPLPPKTDAVVDARARAGKKGGLTMQSRRRRAAEAEGRTSVLSESERKKNFALYKHRKGE